MFRFQPGLHRWMNAGSFGNSFLSQPFLEPCPAYSSREASKKLSSFQKTAGAASGVTFLPPARAAQSECGSAQKSQTSGRPTTRVVDDAPPTLIV
jgi:hypothetical protein